ncbi:MAG TPA: lipid-A-disaccharide synthase [Bacteroidales bacterium]|jgi:lipid-A-disaccharide synthase|nr:lipid-A-disaccharide synthase [Bacteroidales bacterium]MBP7035638.1 lipid-A-disaccharide synthase [Bacteroidales bacterium]MBP8709767.1 lipid-A-disaccharide synthase [Bacteroidales bacterium]HHV00071.1 lipid-A-disaccharide synthase [Bacteroidales bacterium]HOT16463.1 lipid-A-disaccharide synthase [Bacteroidales bacterium]
MKYFIIAGEPSGDLHGSNLVKHLLKSDPAADIACWGGELMQGEGARLLKHYRETAFMGVFEVLVNIRKVKANFSECKRQIMEMKPDVVILIDYPGFNLRMARFAKEAGLRVFYYISPKFWAWREGRVRKIKRYTDRLYIIFPFEKEFYRKHDFPAIFLGNPLIDHIDAWRATAPDREIIRALLGLDARPVIALLSGSRLQEVSKILPVMAEVSEDFPDYQFVVTAMDHLPARLYEEVSSAYPVRVITGRTYDLLAVAEAALVTSGTATLEAALFDVPQAVCYSTSRLTYRLAKWLIRVRFISLVNLIMDREVVRELIQEGLNSASLHRELEEIVATGYRHERIKDDYRELRTMLGGGGASARVAADMIESLVNKKAG